MLPPVKDVRGNPIETGCIVAYNLSGHVAIGEVVKTKPGPFHVMLSHPAAGMPRGHISRVRREGSLIVLTPADMP